MSPQLWCPLSYTSDLTRRLRRLPKLHALEISNRILGFGGERNAYRAQFVHATGFTTPDEQWVVKESRCETETGGQSRVRCARRC